LLVSDGTEVEVLIEIVKKKKKKKKKKKEEEEEEERTGAWLGRRGEPLQLQVEVALHALLRSQRSLTILFRGL
jgi:hypothetical protein